MSRLNLLQWIKLIVNFNTDFIPFSIISIVDFGLVNLCWDQAESKQVWQVLQNYLNRELTPGSISKWQRKAFTIFEKSLAESF